MEKILFSAMFELPWWGFALVGLLLTHITIISVTVFLHRHQAHRALDLHPALSHFFRGWLWLTTGMVTKEWAAVHRKHHAKCDTAEDPHSPQAYGLSRVLWGGVFLYVKEAQHRETLERYGQGTPDDWIERNLYSSLPWLGLVLMGAIDVLLFGIVPGLLIVATQIVWIPFWAAGVINGIGHFWGYRSWATPDWSANISPWGVLIGGEELHNNHHAFPTSARLSIRPFEFDIGWMYIRCFEELGLARVKHVAPTPCFVDPKTIVDQSTLQAVIANRYDVLANFAKSFKRAFLEEHPARGTVGETRDLARWLKRDEKLIREPERLRLAEAIASSRVLQTMLSMRHELSALWGRSADSREQLVRQLQEWCKRAEASGILQLVEFSRRVRSYA